MKRLVVLFLLVLLGVSVMFGQTQSALPPGTVAPAPTAPAPAATAPASQTSDATVVEEIIVRINNSIISLSDLKRSQDQLTAEMARQNPDGAATGPQPRPQDLLRDLIDAKLLTQKATELGISADTDVIKRLDDLRKQMHAETMEDLEKAAQAQGVSFEEFKQNMKDTILTQKVIQQEVGAHLGVTQQELLDYYNQHKAEMEQPEQVRLSEILISTQPKAGSDATQPPSDEVVAQAKAKADAVYAELQSGKKFPEVAKANSAGPTAAQGGDLEYFKRGTLSKQLEDQVFAMKAGQFTEPVRTNQGWVILKVTEHTSEGVPPFKEVEGQIQERVYMSKMQPALREYLTKLREDAYIDVKPPYVDTGASPNETKPIYTTASASDDSKKEKKKKKYILF